MSQNASAWFREVIKDKVTLSLQSHGGLLDGTMMAGDTEAGTIKFPIMTGKAAVYKLTGAIQLVPVTTAALSTVQLQPDDFEASSWWRTQDAYKSGPSEQDALKRLITKAIRRKRDTIKLDALTAFQAANAAVTTIGNGSQVPDVTHFEQARSEIAAYGTDDEVEVFTLIPAMWMTQLCFYKEFADATWTGPDNAPFSKTQRSKMRTVRGVHYIEGPDEYFVSPAGGQLYAWMWAKDAMGAETPVDMENATLSQHTEYEGSPWLAKAPLSGAAIGIQPEYVKRLHLQKLTAPVRPA